MTVTEPAWGRVAEDGTVFVRTSDGERAVGSFQAGSADEALAYYTRKFDALEFEVELFERRVRLPELSADEANATLHRLREVLAEPAAVGDLDGLRTRLEAVSTVVEERRAQARAAREESRTHARELRERIVSDAEALSGSTQWKSTGERLRELLEEWKAAPHVDRPTEQALWKRFGAARNSFDRRRRQHFAQLGAQRGEAKAAKQKLIAEAETLATSTDWGPTATQLRTLMDQWKAAGALGRSEEDALWRRFRAAQDAFYEARSAAFAERDAGLGANLSAKEGLAAEAEALLPVTDTAAAKAALRGIQERWEAAGTLGRSEEDALWRRFRAAQDAFYEARSAAFAERDAGLGANLAAKEGLAAEAEALLPVTDTAAAKAALRGIQERWEAAGHVPRQDRDRVEGRLRKVEEAIRRADETRWRRTNPEGRARAESAVAQLVQAIEKLEAQRAKAVARGDERAVTEADESIAARRSWLEGAEAALAEFTGE